MLNYDVILTFSGGFAVALILGFIDPWIGFSLIVGYLLASNIVGPHTPGFVASCEVVE